MRICPKCGAAEERRTWQCGACAFSPSAVEGFPAIAPELAAESEGFEAEYFPQLAGVESSSFWFQGRNRLIVQSLRRYYPLARRILEIGCGTGAVLEAIHAAFCEAELFGSDIFVDGLRFAGERVPSAELFQMDATRIPFEKEFDVVCALDVIEHIGADGRALEEVYKSLRPGGVVLLTVPQHASLWSAVDEYSRHRRRYSRRELTDKAGTAGFEMLFATSFVSFLLPAMWVSRRMQARSKKAFDPLAEYRMPTWVSRLLGLSLAAERFLIGKGISLPAGGSLLYVGRRREN